MKFFFSQEQALRKQKHKYWSSIQNIVLIAVLTWRFAMPLLKRKSGHGYTEELKTGFLITLTSPGVALRQVVAAA